METKKQYEFLKSFKKTNQVGTWNVLQIVAIFFVIGIGGILQSCNDHHVKIGSLTDSRDGQVYHTVIFGDAGEWMTENLAYDPIDNRVHGIIPMEYGIGEYFTPYFCTPNNLSKDAVKLPDYNGGRIGFLYNWAAAMNIQDAETTSQDNNNQGICPDGWHIPTDAEWDKLKSEVANNPDKYSTLSGNLFSVFIRTLNAGRAFKSVTILNREFPYSTDGYSKPANQGGFNSLLVGQSMGDGTTDRFGVGTIYWSSSSETPTNAWIRSLIFDTSTQGVYRNAYFKDYLFSVRCVCDLNSDN
jgi:uncharacterized protein (TIGR02145 family)